MSAGYKNVTHKEGCNNIHASYKMTPERILTQQSTGYKNVTQKEDRNNIHNGYKITQKEYSLNKIRGLQKCNPQTYGNQSVSLAP